VKKIKIKVNKNGSFTLEVENHQGTTCELSALPYLKKLGMVDVEKKEEYFLPEQTENPEKEKEIL
jgi:hypothetical protein